jgi:hypothetical protein
LTKGTWNLPNARTKSTGHFGANRLAIKAAPALFEAMSVEILSIHAFCFPALISPREMGRDNRLALPAGSVSNAGEATLTFR